MKYNSLKKAGGRDETAGQGADSSQIGLGQILLSITEVLSLFAGGTVHMKTKRCLPTVVPRGKPEDYKINYPPLLVQPNQNCRKSKLW